MKATLVALITALALAGCSSGGQESTSAPSGGAEAGAAGSVSVEDFAFDPETVTAKVGEEVTWTVAEGATAHTVKFDDEESEQLDAGASYSRTFDQAGEFKYVCGIHPQMTGTVTVE